jgi:hypothetical protein
MEDDAGLDRADRNRDENSHSKRGSAAGHPGAECTTGTPLVLPSTAERVRLSDNATAPDPVAQFFLAMLYQSGRGVEPNALRACGLFVGATKPANPFMQQASELANQSGGKIRQTRPITLTAMVGRVRMLGGF